MEAYAVDWINLLVRWLHLVSGVAWIGASFYFVMLDNSLTAPKKPEDAKRGVFGELWAVHGGGFYNSQKYLTGPKGEPLSENLHWSKWEAYTTWLSGMGLLAIIYWYGASSYLIDKSVLALSPGAAIAISIAFLTGGWLVYDLLCRFLTGRGNVLADAMLLLERRMARTATLAEKLFAFMIMGDDRAVHATHVLGSPAHMRTHA